MHHILFFGGVFVLVSKAPYIAYLPIYQLLFTEIFKGKINWKKYKNLRKSLRKIDFFFVVVVNYLSVWHVAS